MEKKRKEEDLNRLLDENHVNRGNLLELCNLM